MPRGTDKGSVDGCTHLPDIFSATGYSMSLKTTARSAETLLQLLEISRRYTTRREPLPDSPGHGLLRILAFEKKPHKTKTFFSKQITGHVSFPRDILVTDVFV